MLVLTTAASDYARRIDELEAEALTGADVWMQAVDVGIQAADEHDNFRWLQGDLALLVDKRYGEDAIGEFAREINVHKSTLKEYRRVSAFYTKDARASFLSDMEGISWSHCKLAMRHKTLDAARAFLEECASEGLTIASAKERLLTQLGSNAFGRKPLVATKARITDVYADARICEVTLLIVGSKEEAHALAKLFRERIDDNPSVLLKLFEDPDARLNGGAG